MHRLAGRSTGIAAAAIAVAVNGTVALVAGLLLGALLIGPFFPVPLTILRSFANVMFGLAMLYAAYGLRVGNPWAWLASILIQGLDVVFVLLMIVSDRAAIWAWANLILGVPILLYLTRSSVRDALTGQRARR